MPLTLFWRLVIALSAVVGAGTCVALGLLYAHFFIAQVGTMTVLERPATERDVLEVGSVAGAEAEIASARFLAIYEYTDYYAAKSVSADDVRVVGQAITTGDYWEFCEKLADGRDVAGYVAGPDGRNVALVPDQFDHGQLEPDGWVTLHHNLMIQPLASCKAPLVCR